MATNVELLISASLADHGSPQWIRWSVYGDDYQEDDAKGY